MYLKKFFALLYVNSLKKKRNTKNKRIKKCDDL